MSLISRVIEASRRGESGVPDKEPLKAVRKLEIKVMDGFGAEVLYYQAAVALAAVAECGIQPNTRLRGSASRLDAQKHHIAARNEGITTWCYVRRVFGHPSRPRMSAVLAPRPAVAGAGRIGR